VPKISIFRRGDWEEVFLPPPPPGLDSLPCAERRFIISDVRDADQTLPLVLDSWSAPQRLLARMMI
jgi:hypothetical protein